MYPHSHYAFNQLLTSQNLPAHFFSVISVQGRNEFRRGWQVFCHHRRLWGDHFGSWSIFFRWGAERSDALALGARPYQVTMAAKEIHRSSQQNTFLGTPCQETVFRKLGTSQHPAGPAGDDISTILTISPSQLTE